MVQESDRSAHILNPDRKDNPNPRGGGGSGEGRLSGRGNWVVWCFGIIARRGVLSSAMLLGHVCKASGLFLCDFICMVCQH